MKPRSIFVASLIAGTTVLLISGVSTGSSDSSDGEAPDAPEFAYVGVKKCKMCHKKKDGGQQFQLWKESRHSRAFETLGSEKAAEYAKERDIKGSPQEAPECLRCHVTAYDMDPEALEASNITIEEGVSCESCHGPGSAYFKKTLMERISKGEEDGAAYGLITPDEQVCIGCHNEESPAFTGFDFEEGLARIAHPRPSPD